MIYLRRQKRNLPKRASGMRKLILSLWICCLFVFILNACAYSNIQKGENVPIPILESYRYESISPFNSTIEEALIRGENWPGDPVLIVINLFKVTDLETPYMSMTKENDPGENPNRTTITVFRDGFLDDSVRGDWHYFELGKMNDQGWRFTEIRRAFLCRRGIQTEKLGKELCP